MNCYDCGEDVNVAQTSKEEEVSCACGARYVLDTDDTGNLVLMPLRTGADEPDLESMIGLFAMVWLRGYPQERSGNYSEAGRAQWLAEQRGHFDLLYEAAKSASPVGVRVLLALGVHDTDPDEAKRRLQVRHVSALIEDEIRFAMDSACTRIHTLCTAAGLSGEGANVTVKLAAMKVLGAQVI